MHLNITDRQNHYNNLFAFTQPREAVSSTDKSRIFGMLKLGFTYLHAEGELWREVDKLWRNSKDDFECSIS